MKKIQKTGFLPKTLLKKQKTYVIPLDLIHYLLALAEPEMVMVDDLNLIAAREDVVHVALSRRQSVLVINVCSHNAIAAKGMGGMLMDDKRSAKIVHDKLGKRRIAFLQ